MMKKSSLRTASLLMVLLTLWLCCAPALADTIYSNYVTVSVKTTPVATATPEAEVTVTAAPETSVTPDPEATVTPDTEASLTPDPEATVTPDPEASETSDPDATVTPDPEASETPDPEATITPDPEASVAPGPEAGIEDADPLKNVSIQIVQTTDKQGQPLQYGDVITLTAKVSGAEGIGYTLEWECQLPGSPWQTVPNETPESVIFAMTEATENSIWRVKMNVISLPQPEAAPEEAPQNAQPAQEPEPEPEAPEAAPEAAEEQPQA